MSEQRWGSVPTEPLPLRQQVENWWAGSRELVEAFIGRQATDEVIAWIDERAAGYAREWPREKPARCRCEAMMDLIAWQRRRSVSGILEWLREWEETVVEMARV